MVCCCKNRPFFAAVLVLGLLGIAFNLVGFVAPGWIVMKRTISITEISAEKAEAMMVMQNMEERDQLIDNGGVRPPPDAAEDKMDADAEMQDADAEWHPHGRHHDRHDHPHHGPHPHGPHHHGGEEPAMFEEWAQEIMLKTEVKELKVCYGLFFSRVCVGEPRGDKSDKEDQSTSSENSEEEDGKGHHHDCKKISTKCALAYSYLFGDLSGMTAPQQLLSPRNMGHASLKEHQIELSAAIALMVVGLIAGVVAFRKHEGPKVAAIICILCFLVSAVLVSVPVLRFAHFSHHRSGSGDGVKVHFPYSVIFSGVGLIFILIATIVATFGLYHKTRKEQPGKWYQLNNETANQSNKEKPALVFISEPLPEKAGLYDICNFDDLKPAETMQEPEKVALA